MNHRVKNHLSILTGLIDMENWNGQNGVNNQGIQNLINKIQSVAMVHDKLHSTDQIEKVPMHLYLKDLAASLKKSFSGDNFKLQIKEDLAEIAIPVSFSLPIGLLVNECFTNAVNMVLLIKPRGP